MSSKIIAPPHDATNSNQSTNIINHDKNTTLSDRTLTPVNDGQKKKRVGRKTHKHKRLEVDKDTKEPPFDAKDAFDAKEILPESKALKSISKLLESMKKVARFPDLRSTFTDPYKQSESTPSGSLNFECIDGSSRTYPPVQDAEPITKITPANSISPPQQQQLQPSTRKTTPRRQREGLSANFERNRAFTIGLAGILQQDPIRSVENKSHTTQVLPKKEQKRPHPKINERCRRWLRNECDLGYQCNFVHEDLEYDVPPVSFQASIHHHANREIMSAS